jgi:hypothetical protein
MYTILTRSLKGRESAFIALKRIAEKYILLKYKKAKGTAGE